MMAHHTDIGPSSRGSGLHVEAVPSSQVVAHVRHRRPPGEPPAVLAPWVAWVDDDAGGDWTLTEDAIAFGEPEVTAEFIAWRRQWQHYWVLESVSGLARLQLVIDRFRHEGRLEIAVLDRYLSGDAVMPPEEQAQVLDDVAALRSALARCGEMGFGFVDATPGSAPIGLARTWSPEGGPEVLAASDRVIAAMQPDDGLVVTVADDEPRCIAGVQQYELAGDTVRLTAPSGVLEIGVAEATPLAWLVPAATVWRVRAVPLPLVWARTTAGLDEACRVASSIGAPVRLSSRRHVDLADHAVA